MLIGDSLTNIVSGLGTTKDKATHARFTRPLISRMDLDNMYAGDWIAGTIVDAPCDDMTRAWRSWIGGTRQLTSLEEEEAKHGVQAKVNQAMKLGRLYGGGAILIGIRGDDPTKPLNLAAVQQGGLEFIHVLSRHEINAETIERDPLSPFYGEPQSYQLSGISRSTGVHPSRVVRFLGQAPLENGSNIDGWGSSVLERSYTTIRNVSSTADNVASLIYEAKIDVVKVPGLTENAINPQYASKIQARFGLANMMKSIQNMLLLDANEDWSQKSQSFSGLIDVLAKQLEMAAGAAAMPVSRLLGRAPTGLNATVDSEVRQWYDTLKGRQQVELTPALTRLDEIIIRSALGSRPKKVWYTWNPMWQLSDAEKAKLEADRATRDTAYAEMELMDPDAMREAIISSLIDGGVYPALEQAWKERKEGAKAPASIMPPKATPKPPAKG